MEAITRKKKDSPATSDAAATASQDEKRHPIKTIRVDDCSASIWSREHIVQGKPTTFHSVTLERSFMDRDGARKWTKSFNPESLPKLIALCQQASDAIHSLQDLAPATAED